MAVYSEHLPKYLQIKDIIKSRIESGFYKRGQKLKPRSELAREFNTTLATCSKAIDELLAEKELDSKIGTGTFVADISAAQKFQVYAVVRTLNNPFYGKFADTLGQVLERKGFLPSKTISVQYDPKNEARIVRGLLEENNLRIVLCSFMDPETKEMVLAHPEIFYIYGYAPEFNGQMNQFIADAETGAFIGVTHLIEMGHRDIGIVEAAPSFKRRINGYKRALAEAGIEFDQEHVVTMDNGSDNLPQEKLNSEMNAVIDKFLKLRRRPSAVFFSSDFLALNFMSICQMRGIRIPDDFSVCTYGGLSDGYSGAYRITTAALPLEELFSGVIDHFSDNNPEAFLALKMNPYLVSGNTVKKICKG